MPRGYHKIWGYPAQFLGKQESRLLCACYVVLLGSKRGPDNMDPFFLLDSCLCRDDPLCRFALIAQSAGYFQTDYISGLAGNMNKPPAYPAPLLMFGGPKPHQPPAPGRLFPPRRSRSQNRFGIRDGSPMGSLGSLFETG